MAIWQRARYSHTEVDIMGIRNAGAVLTAPSLTTQDIVVLSPKAARRALRKYCHRNCFTDSHSKEYRNAIINKAFDLFRHAANQPGEPVIVFTTDEYGNTTHQAAAAHDCMEAITSNPISAELAQRGFDTAPGTHFVHDLRDDACQLTAILTNAPAGG